jgi:diketogulonate reductase-like aldo/keto reductase
VGTYLIRGDQTKKIIDDALAAGYRLFDTAHMYNNERDLGQAFKELLPKHNLTRNDIFITTKFGEAADFLTQHEKFNAYIVLGSSFNRLQE